MTKINLDTTTPNDSLSVASSASSKRKSMDTIGTEATDHKKKKLEKETSMQEKQATVTSKPNSGQGKKQSKLSFQKMLDISSSENKHDPTPDSIILLDEFPAKTKKNFKPLVVTDVPNYKLSESEGSPDATTRGSTMTAMVFGTLSGLNDTPPITSKSKLLKNKKEHKTFNIMTTETTDEGMTTTFDDHYATTFKNMNTGTNVTESNGIYNQNTDTFNDNNYAINDPDPSITFATSTNGEETNTALSFRSGNKETNNTTIAGTTDKTNIDGLSDRGYIDMKTSNNIRTNLIKLNKHSTNPKIENFPIKKNARKKETNNKTRGSNIDRTRLKVSSEMLDKTQGKSMDNIKQKTLNKNSTSSKPAPKSDGTIINKLYDTYPDGKLPSQQEKTVDDKFERSNEADLGAAILAPTRIDAIDCNNKDPQLPTFQNKDMVDIEFLKASDPDSEEDINEATTMIAEIPKHPSAASLCVSNGITMEEIQVIPLEDKINLDNPDDLLYIEAQVCLAKNAIKLLTEEPIFRQATDAKFIQALCNMTNITIDFSRISNTIKGQLLSDAIYILSHDEFSVDEILHIDISEECLKTITAIQGAPPKDTKQRLTRLLNNIKEGYIKPIDRIRNWNIFSKMFGLFLPPTAFTKTLSSNLLNRAIQELTTIPFTKVILDAYNFAVILNYTGESIAINCSSPGCCIDLGIPRALRMAYLKRCNFQLNQVEDHKFGSSAWCSCVHHCTNDLFSGDIVCKTCEQLTHEDCCSEWSNDTICNSCSDGRRIIWMFNGKYHHIELPKSKIPYIHTTTFRDNSALSTKSLQTDSNASSQNDISLKHSKQKNNHHASSIITTASSIAISTPSSTNISSSNAITSTSSTTLPQTSIIDKSPTVNNSNDRARIITPSASCLLSKTPSKENSTKTVGFGQSDQIRLFSIPQETTIYTTRFTVRLSLPTLQEDEDDVEVLRKILSAFITRLHQADNCFECLPWSSSLPDQTPLDLDDIPYTMESLQIFFDRVRYDTPAVYTDIRFKHSRQWEHIKQELSSWLRNRGYSIVKKKLQDERTRPIGWFLFSSKNYDSDSLIAAIQRKHQMEIDIRFSTLRFTRGEDLGEKPAMAHMAWSSEENELEFRRKLFTIYNRSHEYPLGIMMRFIPMHNHLSQRQISNARIARSEQSIFTTSIRSITVDTIVSLEWRPKGTDIPCLRTIIMRRKTTRTLHNLFFSVTASWRSNCFTFVFPLPHEQEATEYIRTLPGRIIGQYGKDATGFFTEEAASKGLSMTYNPDTDTVQTEEDCEMDGIMNMILKRRSKEIERDEDAKINGELSSDIIFWDNHDRNTLDAHSDDAKDHNDEQEDQCTENFLQQKVIDIRLGDRDDDAGTMRSAATSNSQYGDNVSLDRSSVNSTLPDNDNDSIQSSDGNQGTKKPINRKETVLIANIATLRDREQEYLAEKNEMITEIEELKQFRELFLASNNSPKFINPPTSTNNSNGTSLMETDEQNDSSSSDNNTTHQVHQTSFNPIDLHNNDTPATGNAENKYIPSAGTSKGTKERRSPSYQPALLPATATTQPHPSSPIPPTTNIAEPPIFDPNSPWGDTLSKKRPNTVRIAFRNVSSLPKSSTSSKNKGIIKDIQDAELDLFGMSEINLAWQKIQEPDSLHTRFRADFEASRFVSSNNRLDSPIGSSSTQYGGTLLGAINRTAYRISDSGQDERKLGRWSWLSLQGRNGSFTRIMSIYRPVKSKGATGTYQQQAAALAQDGISICPRQLFFDDLSLILERWIQQGDRVIVGGDFNESIQSYNIQTFFFEILYERNPNV